MYYVSEIRGLSVSVTFTSTTHARRCIGHMPRPATPKSLVLSSGDHIRDKICSLLQPVATIRMVHSTMAQPRTPKEEQLSARDEVTELAPGILRTQLPINFTGLGHVNMYVLIGRQGVTVVDPGMPFEDSYANVIDRLARCDVRVGDVTTVVITHSHPDHYGGGGRLAEESGATVLAERSFHIPGQTGGADLVDGKEFPDLHITPSGIEVPWRGEGDQLALPTDGRPRSQGALGNFQAMLPLATPGHHLDDGDIIELADRSWRAMHTPGHTGDHLCLYDLEGGMLLSGDHVLPSITPHISSMGIPGDALDAYFQSLAMVVALPADTRVLPAHGHPFVGIRERVDSILEHHAQRLQRLVDIVGGHGFDPVPVATLSQCLFSERQWGLLAESETYAHLEHLCTSGRLRRDLSESIPRYAMAP